MLQIIVSAFLLFLTTSSMTNAASAKGDHAWNYDSHGPDAWPHLFAACKGKKQSPINILKSQVDYDKNLKPFKFYNYDKVKNWNCSHNGHTVVVSELNEKSLSVGGSDFDYDFDLLQFHFHWGHNPYQGSEHYIDGEKFPLEMHLVHKSKRGDLTVVGFLFKISAKNNDALNPLLEGVAASKNQESWKNVSFSLSSILPDELSLDKYYRYSGSLTTPPCSEGVIWNVVIKNIEISQDQIQSFYRNDLKLNFREPQHLYNRKVFSSFPVSKKIVVSTHKEPACANQHANKASPSFQSPLSIYAILLLFSAMFVHL